MYSYLDKSYNLPVCKYRGGIYNLRFPCWVSLKLDGELTYVIKKGEKIFSVNKPKYGRFRFGYKALEEFKELGLPDGIYLGELYWDEGRTKEDFYNFLSHKVDDGLKLSLWGILQYGTRTRINSDETYRILEEIREKIKEKGFKYLSVVEFWRVNNVDELDEKVREYIFEKGYEGLVIRDDEGVWDDGQTVRFIKVKEKIREQNYKNSRYGIWLNKWERISNRLRE